MPPKPRPTPRNLVEQEGRIQLAISALRKKEISSVQRAVEIFDVPRSTLRGCSVWGQNPHVLVLSLTGGNMQEL
jgi:hypothetical protein